VPRVCRRRSHPSHPRDPGLPFQRHCLSALPWDMPSLTALHLTFVLLRSRFGSGCAAPQLLWYMPPAANPPIWRMARAGWHGACGSDKRFIRSMCRLDLPNIDTCFLQAINWHGADSTRSNARLPVEQNLAEEMAEAALLQMAEHLRRWRRPHFFRWRKSQQGHLVFKWT
jgi:hypothetical protein